MPEQIPTFVYLLIFCFIVGLIRFSRLSPPYIRLLIPFLFLTIFSELATPLRIINFGDSNHWFFNIYILIEFLFFSFIFYKTFQNKRNKKIVILLLVIGMVLYVLNIILIQGFFKFHTISYRVFSLIFITWCLSYFKELLNSENEMVLLRNPMFWISTGLFFFSLGLFFYMNAFDYIVYYKIDYNNKLWKIIITSFNYLLYSFFTIALLCQKRKKA